MFTASNYDVPLREGKQGHVSRPVCQSVALGPYAVLVVAKRKAAQSFPESTMSSFNEEQSSSWWKPLEIFTFSTPTFEALSHVCGQYASRKFEYHGESFHFALYPRGKVLMSCGNDYISIGLKKDFGRAAECEFMFEVGDTRENFNLKAPSAFSWNSTSFMRRKRAISILTNGTLEVTLRLRCKIPRKRALELPALQRQLKKFRSCHHLTDIASVLDNKREVKGHKLIIWSDAPFLCSLCELARPSRGSDKVKAPIQGVDYNFSLHLLSLCTRVRFPLV